MSQKINTGSLIIEELPDKQLLSTDSTGEVIETTVTTKTPINGDYVLGLNSEAVGVIRTTWTTIKAFLKTYFDTLYQAVLVSGTNIKTVNSSSLLGSGDLVISGGDVTGPASSTDNAIARFHETTGKIIQNSGATIDDSGNVVANNIASGATVSGSNTGDQTLPTRDSLGLDTDDSPQFAGINLGHATDTTITRTGAGAIAVEGAAVLLSGGALGTPSSGTLTSCTGLPVNGIVDDTTSALGVGTLELGHATDTTIARSSAGVISVEGVVIPSISSTNTLTNKRITPRIVTAASYTTDTGTSLDVSACDQFEVTAQAGALKFNNPSGTPVAGQKIIIRVKDDGTARALTYDTQYRAIGVTLPATTVVNKTTYLGGIWNATDTKLDILAVAQEA